MEQAQRELEEQRRIAVDADAALDAGRVELQVCVMFMNATTQGFRASGCTMLLN